MDLRKLINKIKSNRSNSASKEKATILKIKAEVLSNKDELGIKPNGGNEPDYVVRMTNSAGDNWYVAAGNGWEGDEDSSGRTAYLALFDGEQRQRHAISMGERHLVLDYYQHLFSSPLRKDAVDCLNTSLDNVSAAQCDDALKSLYKRALYAIDDNVSVERERYFSRREAEEAKQKEEAERQEINTRKEVSFFLKSFFDEGRK